MSTDAEGIRVPSWLIPVIGAGGTFAGGFLVAEDITTYWRPALVPVVGAIIGMFVARPVGKQRMAAQRRAGEIDGGKFGEAATFAQALANQPAKKAPAKPRAAANKK